ncbi:hypothetical protein IPG41_02020 [Candidatus Peregrinibacteria bacterium]|nr:MAG: hypothetical protein IPG41_02020 [Candidatus Peregrinibacteria bacterium]
MKKLLATVLLSSFFLMGCTGAPMFGPEEGKLKTEAFIELAKVDPEAAYAQTSDTLQEITSYEDFEALVQSPTFQGLSQVTFESTSVNWALYDAAYGGRHAHITLTGSSIFSDESRGLVDVIWSYDFKSDVWELEGINFYPAEE